MELSSDILLQWVQHFGPAALFGLLALGIVGLPIPEETLLTLSGLLMAQGKLPIVPTLIAAYLGSMIGITLSYLIGLKTGSFLIKRYGPMIGISHAKLAKAHDWFEHYGKWCLFFGYFILGIRHLTGIVAGSVTLSWRQFMLFAYLGAFFWASLFLSVGYFLNGKWQIIVETVARHDTMFLSLAIFLLVFVALIYWYRKKR